MTQTQPVLAGDLSAAPKPKLHGRAFYESIGSPKVIVAPMVDRSEFAWRMLTRSYMRENSRKSLLAYSPMLHARLFQEAARFRDQHFEPVRDSLVSKEKSHLAPYLDGNPELDRPLFVQFCANNPEELCEAAGYVAPYCDAVDLNLGCPQNIAKSGHYGAFLQEDWDTIYRLINKLHKELPVPVTAKMRILETKEKTLEYAKMILSAGASIICVHGRRREQKGHNAGIADWSMIRYLRANLPPETVIFANGNILNRNDIAPCLEQTGADGVMSAEGNLADPTIFGGVPAPGELEREYWRGSNEQEGYRIDGVFRRYLDIIHHYVLGSTPPERPPLYIPSDPPSPPYTSAPTPTNEQSDGPPRKKRRKDQSPRNFTPNLRHMQGHLFQLLRPMLSSHTDIRNALAKCRVGDISAFERVLTMVEEAVKRGLQEEIKRAGIVPSNYLQAEHGLLNPVKASEQQNDEDALNGDHSPSSADTVAKYRQPWWVCQPYIRPLPEEAVKIGAITLSKKEKARADGAIRETTIKLGHDQTSAQSNPFDRTAANITPGDLPQEPPDASRLPKDALVCG